MDLNNKVSDTEISSLSSSEEEEDEDAKEWTEETEKNFLRTLCYLKKKDPKIYDDNIKFFNDPDGSNGANIEKNKSVEKDKLYLRDYERKIILDKGGIYTDEETDEENANTTGRSSPTYVEEQRRIKEGFKNMLDDDNSDADDCDNNSNDCAGFLKVKVKSALEKEKEEEEYIEWLKGKKDELNDKKMEDDLKYLHDYWTDPNLADGEQFLRDYILNKRYLEPNTNEELSELEFSEEEEMLNEHDEYEQKYNFRFEEPDKEFIKTYPRVIENSLRQRNEKRKKKRELAKQKKEQNLKQKQIELKKLKKAKKQELLEKIEKLKQATGNKELGFEAFDIEKDFNPDEYDQKMSELFNEEFYNVEDDEKPVFSDSDGNNDDDNIDDINEEVNYDDDYNDDEDANYQQSNNDQIHKYSDIQYSYEDVNMDSIDCEYDSNTVKESKFKKQTRSSRKKGHKRSKLMEAVRKKKPLFNPADKSFQEYVDEYYGMEFEDFVGDVPCRFKYRRVIPNNFGLSVEEILVADDTELNKWCTMKKIDSIRNEQSEKFDQKIYNRKAKNLELKKKILPSLFKEETKESSTTSTGNMRNKISPKNRNSKDIKKRFHDSPSVNNPRKKFKSDTLCEISDERLKAYGINPKKYKNKLKYGSKNKGI